MSYEKPGALSNRTDNRSPEAARTARRRRRVGLFFAGWTVFASLAVWWLVRRAETANMDPSWFFEGDAGANGSVAERIGNWFKLADLNFHGIYPWILLAPYVAWLGARFHLERGQWRVSVPAHLAACALFVIASHALDTYSDWGRQVVVKFTTQTRISQDGKKGGNATTGQTNEFTIVTNIPWASLPAPLPGPWGGGQMRQTARAGPTNSPSGSEIAWAAPGNQGVRGGVFIRKHFLGSLLDLLDPCAYAVLVGIVHTVHFYRRSREREGRAAALEAQLTKARLNALQAQLHPHFLFNALNAISTLLRRDTRAAQDALASFSELLRLALCQSTQPEVTLREDLEFLRRYVEIQQTRLGDRLRFEETIAPEALDCLVPALFLQPLVENAIRHGIEPSPNPGVVRVIVLAERERLLVTVEDNGAGLTTKEDERGAGVGIGLQNLRSRMETLYGEKQRVELAPRPEGGVSVRLEIPLRRTTAAEPERVAP